MKGLNNSQSLTIWAEELVRAAYENPDLAAAMAAFEASDSVYQATLDAMGMRPELVTKSAANIVFHLDDNTNRFLT